MIDDSSLVVDPGWVEELMGRFPYFTLPAMLLLGRENDLNDARRQRLLETHALNAPDRETLARVIYCGNGKQLDFYPKDDMKQTPSTNSAIDTFLDNYGRPSEKEEALLTQLIFDPVPDYAEVLAAQEQAGLPDAGDSSANPRDAKINAFILKSRHRQGHFPHEGDAAPRQGEALAEDASTVTPPDAGDDSLLSESLAKIYVRQRRYAKAYEIINNLSLTFPEKSIYFADQLRFLQKLINNQKYKTE